MKQKASEGKKLTKD